MSAHAPAPWKVDAGDERHPGVYLHLRDADGKAVAIVYGATLDQRSANARVLEAGPEMLEALKEAEARFHTLEATNDPSADEPYQKHAVRVVRAAIATAERGQS